MLSLCLRRPAALRSAALLALTILAGPFAVAPASAAPNTVTLTQDVPPPAIIKAAKLLGPMPPAQRVRISFSLPTRNRAKQDELLRRLYTPGDPYYRKYLSSAEYDARFAPTQADYDFVTAFAQSRGFTVVEKHSGRTLLDVSGTVASIQKAFGVQMNRYALADGTLAYANDRAPQVPAALAPKLLGIHGLSDIGLRRRPMLRHFSSVPKVQRFMAAPNASPRGIGTDKFLGGLTPTDIKAAYNLSDAEIPDTKGGVLDGRGEIIGLYQLDGYVPADIAAYTKRFGLPDATLENILVGSADGTAGANQDEVVLDIDMVLALAPRARILVYEGKNGTVDIVTLFTKIADDNKAKSISSSWGISEKEGFTGPDDPDLIVEDAALRKMAAQGQTFFNAAGDAGGYDTKGNIAVSDPASQPFATGVGGTTLTVTAPGGTFVDETVWGTPKTPSGGAGGGGISIFWRKPDYQTKAKVGESETNRNVPDVALNSNPDTGYYIYIASKGGDTIIGGTSAASPLWGGYIGLVNQKRKINGAKTTVGFLNPQIYTLNSNAIKFAANFHDITVGDNLVFSAKPGYDNATGWGSFIGASLLKTLAPPAFGANGTITGTVKNSSGAPIPNATVTATSINPPGITVSATTDANGVYIIKNAPSTFGENDTPITYTVSVDAPGYAGRTVAFLADGSSVTVVPNLRDGTSPNPTVVNFIGLNLGHPFASAGLQMISAPYDYSTTADFAALFGVTAPLQVTDPKLAIWQASLNDYVFYPSAPADTLRLGYGYWTTLPASAYIHREGVPAAQGQPFRITLQAGWNQIGNPFLRPVSVSGLRVENVSGGGMSALSENSAARLPLYRYPPASGAYVTIGAGGMLTPWEGYWIFASRPSTLVVPAP